MTPRPNLNELAKEIYEAYKKKGFHDKEYSNEHYLCLVISELMEAVEADRKGKESNLKGFEYDVKDFEQFDRPEYRYKICFEYSIKDTVADELADAIIRLLDLAGLRGWDIDWKGIVYDKHFHKKPLTVSIYEGVAMLYNHIMSECSKTKRLIAYIEQLAYSLQIDIWRHVDLKMKYNARRERLHGKLY